ncbi:hypothetical protein [Paraburkholderia sp. BL17N1]|uniref:hypothetical protein n=1 Tax=Paraburkholderia sp. BL17N1 TaxID=1938798 RepID=UPI0018F6B3BE|nr:hypothetical protein [Paraburkholderia sp. BL17N1]
MSGIGVGAPMLAMRISGSAVMRMDALRALMVHADASLDSALKHVRLILERSMVGRQHFMQCGAAIAASRSQIRSQEIHRAQRVEQPVTIHRLMVCDAIACLVDALKLNGNRGPVDLLFRENAL